MQLKRFVFILPLALTSFSVISPAPAAPPLPAGVTAKQLVKDADEHRFPQGMVSFTVKVVDAEKGKPSRETEYRVKAKDDSKSLVETMKPERQRGRKLLMLGNDLWFFSPNIKRPARVSMQQKLTGEVSNGDLANTNFAKDYNPEVLAIETIEGKQAYRLKLKARTKAATYSTIHYWLDKQTGMPLLVHYFTASGRLMKVGRFEKYETVLGQKRMSQFRVEDAVAKARSSTMYYSDYKRESFSDSLFSKESMNQ